MIRSLLWGLLWSSVLAASLVLGAVDVEANEPKETALPSLRESYLREKQELIESLESLRERVASLQRQTKGQQGAMEREIQALMQRVTTLRKRNAEAEERLQALKRKAQQAREYGELLEGTLNLGTRTLHEEMPRIRLEGDTPKKIRALFSHSARFLAQRSSIHKLDERFFDRDGEARKGIVIHIGEVAALGVSGERGGVLRKAPGGGLRLVEEDPTHLDAAKALAAGRSIEDIPVYLFDPLRKESAPEAARGFLAFLNAGGPIAWILLLLGSFGVLLVLERAWTLRSLSLGGDAAWEAMISAHQRGDTAQALLLSQRMGLASRVVASLLPLRGASRAALEQRASEAILQAMPRLERSMALLGVLVTVAPLLGLLGTVAGMITTFDVITTHGTGNPKLLSSGIAEALITTELGLSVAIPLMLLRSFFARWSERILEATQIRALLLIQLLQAMPSPAAMTSRAKELQKEPQDGKERAEGDHRGRGEGDHRGRGEGEHQGRGEGG